MALNDNSKDRIKFACKELEDALAIFGQIEPGSLEADSDAATVAGDGVSGDGRTATGGAQLSARQEKIHEIKRQLREIREQLDDLSQ